MSIERSSGVLLHVSSLPNKYGIGTFGQEAYEFIDFLKKSGQHYWQMLPLNPVAEGNSPYSSYSAFALNPYFIDLDLLTKEGLLQEHDYNMIDFGNDPTKVYYVKIEEHKMLILRIAFNHSKEKELEGFHLFFEQNKEWLVDYAEFMGFRYYFQTTLQQWPLDIKRKNPEAMNHYRALIGQAEFDFWIFLQYICNKQWLQLKKYANDNEVRIFGDIPIYMSGDSADVWANPQVFDIDEELDSHHVAGCPPDDFSSDGQRWGMPVYNWTMLEQTDFDWWMKRIERNLTLYDVIRIDHFRGLESYYSIPVAEQTAKNGTWVQAKGKAFFNQVKQQFGEVDIVLEDLGFITEEVIHLKRETGYPGMKIFQLGFLNDMNNPHLPHNCELNSIYYTASHDNDTSLGWLQNGKDHEKRFIQHYLQTEDETDFSWKCIDQVMGAASKLSIIPIQDFLGLGSESRMNIPGVAKGNWEWRVSKEGLTVELSEKMKTMTNKHNRSC